MPSARDDPPPPLRSVPDRHRRRQRHVQGQTRSHPRGRDRSQHPRRARHGNYIASMHRASPPRSNPSAARSRNFWMYRCECSGSSSIILVHSLRSLMRRIVGVRPDRLRDAAAARPSLTQQPVEVDMTLRILSDDDSCLVSKSGGLSSLPMTERRISAMPRSGPANHLGTIVPGAAVGSYSHPLK